jgi:uncharacterized protein with GYD domain
MSTYIMFGNYLPEAIDNISSERTKAAQRIIDDAGGKLRAAYALLGEVDLLLIVDFSNNEKAMKASIELSKLLDIAFTTSPAITADDFDRMFR